MNEYVWPVVTVVVAVLAFLRLRPQKKASVVRAKDFRALAARVEKLGRELSALGTAARTSLGEMEVIKTQVAERLNQFAEDMSLLKDEYARIKNKAVVKAIVEHRAG